MKMADGSTPVNEAPKGIFDLARDRLALSPWMLRTIIVSAISIGGMTAAVHFRLGALETGVAEIRDEVKTSFETLQREIGETRVTSTTKQQAYIDCLEAERTNKKSGWLCPMAPPVKHATPRIETLKTKRVAVKRKEDKPSGWSLWAPATAAPKSKP